MEYDSTTKRNDILIRAPIWMNPENIVKVSHKSPLIVSFHLHELFRKGKYSEIERRLKLPRAWGFRGKNRR